MMGSTPNQIGPYEITREIGRGGMGVVYLARDTKLDRDVAIKCLPDELADDADRLVRFEREAKLLASLNHPNIATIHGLEEVDGKRYLVLEYVEGETLEERLHKGAIPVDEALLIAIQIAEAIEAAHEKGIIHRDLKPANIKFTAEDVVKVLDFGLAKAMDDQPSSITNIADSPTVVQEASPTLLGVILGTAGYLSPEQGRGRSVDKCTDIFSFGCLLYEMLTGRFAFGGDTTQDLIASTIKDDPDLSILPPHTPISAQVLLRLMLIKDARSRLADASACRVLLEDAIQSHNKEQRETVSRPAVQISVEHFVLGENICRRLDRSRLDSRMIGHQMEYLDNKKNSDVLVILLHGPGFNHEQWREHILTLPYLCVAPTQVGFEQDPQVRYRLSIRDHIIVLREFIRDQVARCRPEHTILLGFSAGGDLAMRLVAEFDDEPIPLDGLIAMEPNLSIETCHITSLLAAIDPDDNTTLLKTMQLIGQSMTTLSDWTLIHEYLVPLTRQYQDDFSVVIEYANEIIKPFQTPGPSPFIEWYRSVSAQIPGLRCVFSNSKDYYDRILKIRLDNLDDNCLGPHYKEDSIQIESGTTHLDLIHIDIVKRHLQDVVRQLAGNRIQK